MPNLLGTHMVTKHSEEQGKEYRCHLCHKVFQGDNLLKSSALSNRKGQKIGK